MTSSAACGSSSRTSALFIPITRASSARRVVDDALADHRAVAATSTASPASKLALDLGDADRQQAGAALAQDPRRAVVDDQPPARRLRVLEPELEARRLASPGRRSGCPTGSPAAAAASVPALVPLQITAGMPASLAISAAATLLRIPPEPKAEVRSPISSPASSEKSLDLGDQLGLRVDRADRRV